MDHEPKRRAWANRSTGALLATVLVITACSGGSRGTGAEQPSEEPARQAAEQPEAGSGSEPITPRPEPGPLAVDEGTYAINWDLVAAGASYTPADETSTDPFFHIRTDPDQHGFFFALEMYTTGYGSLWTGELGEVAVSCDEPPPAPSSTGVCAHFDPDGTGDLGADFGATGSITINRLDDSGYDIVVNEIIFTDGSSIAAFRMTG